MPAATTVGVTGAEPTVGAVVVNWMLPRRACVPPFWFGADTRLAWIEPLPENRGVNATKAVTTGAALLVGVGMDPVTTACCAP